MAEQLDRSDVLVIGAGAAGLAAAQVLSTAGRAVTVLEARDRPGGRIHTLRDPLFPLPVELGAEFIHGRESDTFELLRAMGSAACAVDGDHWESRRRGRLTPSNGFWDEIDKVLSRLDKLPRGRDVSFVEFLDTCCKSPSLREARRKAREFVEGFDAARADRISARSLRRAEASSGDGPEGEDSFRLLDGYGSVIDHLLRTARPDRLDLRLRTIVRRVHWRRGHVRVECETAGGTALPAVVARSALVTLPVGVLHAGDVAFEPPLPPAKRRAAGQIEMGPVVKVILKFREPFWEAPVPAAGGKPLSKLCFLHARPNDVAFPTWWTHHPIRASVLTGWAGGPAADRLSHRAAGDVLAAALDSLAATTGIGREQLDGQLDAAHVADWQADPFARGAYSYVAVGGLNAPKQLAAPVVNTLFFAGEATVSEGIGGTVDAALSSGRRAAGEILSHVRAR